MLARVDRKEFFAALKPILGVKRWTNQQTAGLDRLLDGFESDPIIPDGSVGVQRCAYWIYTDWIETGHTLTPIMERGSAAYFIRRYGPRTRKGRELGNDTDEEAIKYRGAGDVQLTGENNREAAEEMIRRNYPEMVARWEALNGRMWDLTIGDQPDDGEDWKNALVPEFSYAIMVAGTTEGLFGPPLNRYINSRICNYRDARRCVNGTDRAAEFAAVCPRIESALRAAIASAAQEVTAVAPAVDVPVRDIPEAAAVAVTPVEGTSTTIENAGAVNLTAAVSSEPSSPVEGGAATDEPRKVTAGSGSWIRSVMTWIAGLFTAASEHVEKVLGLSPDAQKYLIVAVIVVGAVYLVLKAVAEWQVRRIASSPTLQNVK